MKHNIRINGQIKEIDCNLGSGRIDKNGREVFEGDKVNFRGQDKQTYKGVVEFLNGTFFIRYERYGAPNFFVNLGDSFYAQDIEVIRHVDD